ncbi:DUF397 domain-containing protein [Marinactinospora rubrisoli]|uniref:DUF397 domain-containing protein n=1 Tax=Marinactinospora rubrisoli TaxID=2715399 RepID=A0ABW2KLA8_9ACTN
MQNPLLRWRKSSYSSNTGECVEIAEIQRDRLMRDSKNPALGTLYFPDPEWRAFLSALKTAQSTQF